MAVDVSAPDAGGLDLERLTRAAECVLAALGCESDELSVAVVADEKILELNRDYRGRESSTDVLSFSQLGESAGAAASPPIVEGLPPRTLGDVVISIETAARQADAGGWTLEEEVNRLLVHGVLHLLGHRHEEGGEPERVMKSEELRIAASLAGDGFGCATEDIA